PVRAGRARRAARRMPRSRVPLSTQGGNNGAGYDDGAGRHPSGVPADAAVELLGAGGTGLAEALLEPGHAASGVEDLLLAGVEGVALRADLGVDHAVRRCAARR